MGLDQYLTRKVYYGGKYRGKDGFKGKHTLKISGDFAKEHKIDITRISYIEEDTAYWRKANAIHKWFVDNVQEGKDDCKSYDVSTEQLEELLELCNKVIKASKLVEGKINNGYSFDKDGNKKHNKIDGKFMSDYSVAEEMLPVAEGFFFGSTDYDEYYYDDIKYTQKIIKEILAKKYDHNSEFYYQSSW